MAADTDLSLSYISMLADIVFKRSNLIYTSQTLDIGVVFFYGSRNP
jgi:hypothetical protein